MSRIGLYCALFALWMSSRCMARDLALIADKGNSSSTISTKDLVKILKTETGRWPDGRRITIYLGDPGSADGRLFLDRIYRMTPDELKSFAGQTSGIVILGSDELVLKAVAGHPGALGLVNVYSINSAVKVLKVDGKLPMEQGYLLHAN